jgi:hypothetical protein
MHTPILLGQSTFGGVIDQATDPHWADVVLLLHGDGANGSTTISDSSTKGHNGVVTGSTQLSDAQAKFGGTSIKGAAASYCTVTLGTDGLMSGDFTVEMWLWGGAHCAMYSDAGGYLYNSAWQGYGGSNLNTGNFSINDWVHLAISRTGSTMKAFLNGVEQGSLTHASSVDLQTLRFGYYVPNNNLHWTGHWDDVRITKGVGRYTAGFSPPISPFPNA